MCSSTLPALPELAKKATCMHKPRLHTYHTIIFTLQMYNLASDRNSHWQSRQCSIPQATCAASVILPQHDVGTAVQTSLQKALDLRLKKGWSRLSYTVLILPICSGTSFEFANIKQSSRTTKNTATKGNKSASR